MGYLLNCDGKHQEKKKLIEKHLRQAKRKKEKGIMREGKREARKKQRQAG